MSWIDFRRRQEVLDSALSHASQLPEIEALFATTPCARAVFVDATELLSALQYKWTQLLAGPLELAQYTAECDPMVDRLSAVISARQETANRYPTLRLVLDANELPTAIAAHEQRMLALAAGLAEATEPDEQIIRLGAALLAMLQSPAEQTPQEQIGVS